VVHPEVSATVIYFVRFVQGQIRVRSFAFPASASGRPNAVYTEQGDRLASFTSSYRGESEDTTLRREKDGSYSLSLQRKSRAFNKESLYEIRLIQLSNQSAPLPSVPDPGDD